MCDQHALTRTSLFSLVIELFCILIEAFRIFFIVYASSGQTVELPADVHGVVLRESVCPEHVKAQHSEVNSYWTADTSFTEIKVWGHDEQQRDHNVERALEWMQLAKAIHDP
jgi:hypothetical protein